MMRISKFFFHFASLLGVILFFFLAVASQAATPEFQIHSRAGPNALEWGLGFFKYFMQVDAEERNPFLEERLKYETHKLIKKPIPTKIHWRFDAQLMALTSDYTADGGVPVTDWVNGFRIGLGYRPSRIVDTEFRLLAEAAPRVNAGTGGLEIEVTWFLKLPKNESKDEQVRYINPMDLKKIKLERVQLQAEEEEDPDAPKLARYRPPRVDLHFGVGTYRHQKTRGDFSKVPALENLMLVESRVIQTRLSLDADFKWNKRWLNYFGFGYYIYQEHTPAALATVFSQYALRGPLLPGRFSKSAVIQSFPSMEFGLGGTYLHSSKVRYGIEGWMTMFSFTDIASVIWFRPWYSHEFLEDWYMKYSVDAGATRNAFLIMAGLQVGHEF